VLRFRWVDCQLEALKRCPDPEKALESLPATLDETYARILRNIDSDWQPYAIAALQWVAYSTRPLTLDELYDAIVIDTKSKPWFSFERRLPQPRRICGILSSLVIISVDGNEYSRSKGKEVIRLAHFSVKEYLESARILHDPGVSVFQFSEEKSCLYLTECCLFYIKSYAMSESKTNTEEDSTLFPILNHACRNWKTYARRVEDAASSYLADLVFGLLSSDVERKSWILIYEASSTDKTGGALYYASELGFYNIARLSIDTGANVNVQGGNYGSALQAASSRGHEANVQLLLENGANVNAQGGYHSSALYMALGNGHKAIVQLLLENGADVNAQDGDYGSALQAALSNGHKAIVQLLLKNGANVNAQDGDYGSAL
jgi:ankyrin repeat protein